MKKNDFRKFEKGGFLQKRGRKEVPIPFHRRAVLSWQTRCL